MAIMMPASDQAVLDRRDAIVAALRAIVPGEGVIDSAAEMLPYESDGLMAYRQPPMVVVLPDTTEQVSKVLKYCCEQGIKVVPRGSGTSLSGGALPLADGVLLGLGKFKRIREIDFDNRVVVTEPGVTNLAISQAVAHAGFYYAPDPSSQIACSIGGNVAENSGGVHCLKYGMTTNNVLGCEIVLMTRRNPAHRRQVGRERRLRSDGHHHRLRRPARRHHRDHGADPAEAGNRARADGRLCRGRGGRRMRRPHHRRRHHSGRHGDDGQAGDPRRRSLRPCRLSARRRGAADHRTRWSRRRGRRIDRPRRGHRERLRLDHAADFHLRSRAQPVLGRPQGGVSGGGPDFAGLSLHGRHHSARRAAQGAGAHPRPLGQIRSAASPTCFMPATAICIR